MFGHADNVWSENSFQGWMGYKLSTPRVGYFFNCCFILLGERQQGGPERVRQGLHEARIRLCRRQQGALLDESVLDHNHEEAVSSLSLSVSGSEGDSSSWGVPLLTQARKNGSRVFLCNCDWIHFCGLGCVFGWGSRSLHLLCVVGRARQAVSLRSVLGVGNHWAEHVLLLCISYGSIGSGRCRNASIVLAFSFPKPASPSRSCLLIA